MLYKSEYDELVSLLKSGQMESYDAHILKLGATDDQLISSHKEAGVEQKLTDRDMEIQDTTDGLIFDMYRELTGNEPEWDIAIIGDLRDDIIERLARVTGRTEYSFHPYMVMTEDQPPTTLQSIRNALVQQFRNEPHVLMEFESLLDIVVTEFFNGNFETEQDAINHLIDVTGDQAYNWRLFRTLCGARE